MLQLSPGESLLLQNTHRPMNRIDSQEVCPYDLMTFPMIGSKYMMFKSINARSIKRILDGNRFLWKNVP